MRRKRQGILPFITTSIVVGKQNGSATLEARWQFVLDKLYICSSCPTNRYLLKEMKTCVYAKPCTQILMAFLFIIARTLDCSFPMSKGFIVLPPTPNHQLQWVFTLRQVRKIQVGFVHFPQQQPLLSSSLHLQGKLSPTSCPVFLWFCVYVRPCGGWWRIACECELHSYL